MGLLGEVREVGEGGAAVTLLLIALLFIVLPLTVLGLILRNPKK